MHFTQAEIDQLGEVYKQRLKEKGNQLPKTAPSISEMQKWMIANNLESPEVLELLITKVGSGQKAGEKKMSTV